MIYDAYHALANAIVMQAVKDYQIALKYDDTSVMHECERFFRSDWFTFLTDVACKVPSTALCENIMTISKERLGNYIRTCSEQEMSCIDTALLNSLGITPNPIGGGIEETAPQSVSTIETERNLYKTLYEQILNKLIGGNKND